MKAFSRRVMLGGAAACASLAMPNIIRAQDLPHIRFSLLATGFSVLFSDYLLSNKLDRKNGFILDSTGTFVSVSAYYNDFVTGGFDFGFGTWDTFAARYMAGVPLRLLGNLVSANMVSIVASADGPRSLQELPGKALTAAAFTGTFRLTKAFLKEFNGLDLDSQVTLQNVDNPATAVTLVMANRADAALSWEPNISIGLHKAPGA